VRQFPTIIGSSTVDAILKQNPFFFQAINGPSILAAADVFLFTWPRESFVAAGGRAGRTTGTSALI